LKSIARKRPVLTDVVATDLAPSLRAYQHWLWT